MSGGRCLPVTLPLLHKTFCFATGVKSKIRRSALSCSPPEGHVRDRTAIDVSFEYETWKRKSDEKLRESAECAKVGRRGASKYKTSDTW